MFEMVVFGGGEIYRDVLNGVALMAGTNGLSTLVRISMLLGLIFMVMKVAFDMQLKQGFKWFLMSIVIVNLIWVPKAQVHITDRFNPAMVGGDVANVPLGLAVISTLSSQVGARVTSLSEQAFGHPNDVAYSKTGMIFGAKVFERLRTAQFSDPRFSTNMQSFVSNCIYYDIVEGHYTAAELARQNDIWTYVTVTKGTNPGRSLVYLHANGTTDIVSCPVVVQRLNAEWATNLTSSINLFQRRSRPELPEAELRSAFMQEMNALHPMMVGASRDAANTFQQVLMINAIKRGVPSFGAEAGSDAMGVFAETQAELTSRNQQQIMGGVAAKAVPLLKILTELLIIGIFPVLFPAMLLPNMGLKVLQGYFGGFLYLQLWAPMYVILHTIMMWRSTTDTAAAAYIPGTSPGLKLANLEAIGTLNGDIANLAGLLALSIPVLASTIAFGGAQAVGRGGESLMASFRSPAESAAAAATTGNISLGNTAFANHSFQNLSGLKQSTSPDVDQGLVRYNSGVAKVTETADGRVSITQAPQSQLAASIRHTDGVANTLSEGARNSRQMAIDLSHSISEGRTRAQADQSEFSKAWMTGTTSTFLQGRDDREAWAATEAQMDSTSKMLQEQYRISETQAKQLTVAAAAELRASADAGISTPIGGAKVAGSLSTSTTGSRTGTTSEEDARSAARSSLSDHSYRDSYDKSVANYSSQTFAQTQSASQTEALRRTDTFTSQRSITDAMTRSENEAKAYEQRAEQVKTQGVNADINYANQFEDFAINRLVGRMDADGGYIDRDRARAILGGYSTADTNLLQEITTAFHQEKAAELVTPELVQQNRGIGATVVQAQPGEVRILEENSFGNLSHGVGRGSAGVIGQPLSIDSAGSDQASHGNGNDQGRAVLPNAPQTRRDPENTIETANPGQNWAGEGRLQTGFNSPERERIRADTSEGASVLGSRAAPNFEKGFATAGMEVLADTTIGGKVTADAISALNPNSRFPEGRATSQQAGGRLARRYPE